MEDFDFVVSGSVKTRMKKIHRGYQATNFDLDESVLFLSEKCSNVANKINATSDTELKCTTVEWQAGRQMQNLQQMNRGKPNLYDLNQIKKLCGSQTNRFAITIDS